MSPPSRSTSRLTSAKSRAGLSAVPAKITSSMPAPRIDLGELSPITQRIASSTFDLPQPLGPTIPVSPSSTRNSAGSTKLLKPESLSPLTLISFYRAPQPRSAGRQHRLEPRPILGADQTAVDEKNRRAVDAELIGAAVD